MGTAERLAGWMRRQLASTGARGFVVGLSGGVDSAVVARLAQLAARDNIIAAILPAHSDPADELDALTTARHFSFATVRVDLSDAYDATTAAIQSGIKALPVQSLELPAGDPIHARRPLANLKPRLRMAALYHLANRFQYLVAGTGNRSELAIGYYTKHGDGACDLLPLGRLLKSEVRALAKELGVPAPVVERSSSAGLWIGQTDEEEIGFSYADLERYLEEGPQGVSPALAMRIERLTRSSEHKRTLPPMPDL